MSFAHAPVTKWLLLETGTASVLAGAFAKKHYLNVPLSPHIARDHQYWRFLVHHIAFANSSELFLFVILLFNIGAVVERIFGTTKFASFIAVSIGLTTIIELISLSSGLFPHNNIPAGPFALAFAILVQYLRAIPAVYTYKIGSFTLSNKMINYALALQLFVSQGLNSILPCLIGLLVGAIYRSDPLGTALRAWRVPIWSRRLASKLVPLLGSTRPPRRSDRTEIDGSSTNAYATASAVNAMAGQTAQRRGGGTTAIAEWRAAFAGTGAAGAARPPTLTMEQRSSLQAMFPSATVPAIDSAWQRANGDLNRAVEMLLSST